MNILEQLNLDFFKHVIILLSLMAGFTGFKIAACSPFKEGGEEFSWKKLGLGTAKHLIALFGLSLAYLACSIFGEDLVLVKINNSTLTIQAALDVVMLAVIAQYGLKLINDMREYFKAGENLDVQENNKGVVDPEGNPVTVENLEEVAKG